MFQGQDAATLHKIYFKAKTGLPDALRILVIRLKGFGSFRITNSNKDRMPTTNL